MNCVLVFDTSNAPVIETAVRNALTGAVMNDAIVTVTIVDQDNVPLTGTSWPVSVPYVSASAGIYRVQLPSNMPLVVGQVYKAQIQITDVDSNVQNLVYEVVVASPGCGSVVSTSSPASPNYRPASAQTQLNEARAALHLLHMGQSARVIVDQNGERVEFTAANAGRLSAYISVLEQQLGLSVGRCVGPVRAYF